MESGDFSSNRMEVIENSESKMADDHRVVYSMNYYTSYTEESK